MGEELKMTVSPICTDESGKKKYAYVTFSDGTRSAEGKIPSCEITKNDGFSDEEAAALHFYMKTNLEDLKKIAAKINVFEALKK
ncbi:MAG: hypothetical protein PUG04_06210 [Lachnospiraceae bacterium]|nr:hypothetical protein [Lachnospiraceae bacterium]